MLMTIEIEIELVFQQHWQVVCYNVCKVRVPFAPHWMVQNCCFPDHVFVLVPFVHGLVDPVKLIIAHLSDSLVGTDNITQLLVLLIE